MTPFYLTDRNPYGEIDDVLLYLVQSYKIEVVMDYKDNVIRSAYFPNGTHVFIKKPVAISTELRISWTHIRGAEIIGRGAAVSRTEFLEKMETLYLRNKDVLA